MQPKRGGPCAFMIFWRVCSRDGWCAVASEGVQQFGGCAAIRCSILGGLQYFGGGCAVFWRVCSILEGVQYFERVCSRVGGCAVASEGVQQKNL